MRGRVERFLKSNGNVGTLTTFFCHNRRGDVSVLITDTGTMVEWLKCSSYGVQFGLPMGDTDSDGDATGASGPT